MSDQYNKIPLESTSAFYQFSIRLSGVSYVFHMRWNERAGRWFLDLHSAADEPLATSIPLLIKKNLLGRYAIPGLPAGVLYINDDTGQASEPGRDAWGTTHTMYYVEVA